MHIFHKWGKWVFSAELLHIDNFGYPVNKNNPRQKKIYQVGTRICSTCGNVACKKVKVY